MTDLSYYWYLVNTQQAPQRWCQDAANRAELVALLRRAQRSLGLGVASFCLGVALLDRLLARLRCPVEQLRLAACACLLLASKYHDEDASARASDLVRLLQLDQRALCTAERRVYEALGYRVAAPTAIDFVHQLCADATLLLPAKQLICIALHEPASLDHAPLVLAAAALRVVAGWKQRVDPLGRRSHAAALPPTAACERLLRAVAEPKPRTARPLCLPSDQTRDCSPTRTRGAVC